MIAFDSGFLIAEEYIKRPTLIKIAKAILRAQDIQEDSWVHEESKYIINQSEAAKIAVEELKLSSIWTTIIDEWNRSQWNFAQDWADAILEKFKK